MVGAVPGNVLAQLGVRTSARSVWLHPDVVLHIGEQRAAKKRRIETGDAAFALRHLPATILRPDYCGIDRRDVRGRRIDLVREVRGTGRFLFVSVKVVTAANAHAETDEIWVCTAHPLGSNFLTQKRYRDTLQEVRWARS